jgi:hypothetical protein
MYTPAITSPPPIAMTKPNGSPSSGTASAKVANGSRQRYMPARVAPSLAMPTSPEPIADGESSDRQIEKGGDAAWRERA